MIEFNINHYVMVKLTEDGISELKRQHRELRKEFPSISEPYVLPKADDAGWSKFQMHDLMNRLGHMVVMGSRLPFETTVRLDV